MSENQGLVQITRRLHGRVQRLQAAWLALALLAVLAVSGGCGSGAAAPQLEMAAISHTIEAYAGAPATWRVEWEGGTGPYTVTFNMGSGTTEGTYTEVVAASPCAHTFTMVNPSAASSQTYPYTISIRGADGTRISKDGNYLVYPQPAQ